MKILVIGAGLSGLVAAGELQKAAHEVVVIEARDRVGGRVFTIRDGIHDGQYADVGAEMIYHGQDRIATLCARHDLELTSELSLGTDAPDIIFHGRRLTTEARQELAEELRGAVRRVPPGHYETVAQWLRRAHLSDGAERLLEAIAQGTPAAPLRLADAQELDVELSWGKGYRKIRGGNDRLPQALAGGIDVRLDQVVRLVGYAGAVTVETERETFRGDRVLVTVPGPLVSELAFDPLLPAEKVRALLQLRYGNGTRLVAQYADKEAVRGAIGMGCFTDRMPGYIMEQTMQQPGDHIVISGLAAGDVEPALMNEQETLDAFDRTISAVVGTAMKRSFGLVKNWTKDPFTRAIVRAPLGDQRETVLPEISRPLDGRVFFAGEHTDDRVGPGGMEGAIRSAYRENEHGVNTRLIGNDALAGLVPGINTADLQGAAYGPTDGYLDPNSMVAGYATGARRAGVLILQDSPVTTVETAGGRVTGRERAPRRSPSMCLSTRPAPGRRPSPGSTAPRSLSPPAETRSSSSTKRPHPGDTSR